MKKISNFKSAMQNQISNSQKGFTLIELLIVIGVLGILAAGVLAVLDPLTQIQKANDAKRKSNLAQIQRALESYYQDHGRYPEHTTPAYEIKTSDVSEPIKKWGSEWQPYMNVLPKDKDPYRYVYASLPDGQTYYLYASLERNGKDPQSCSKDGSACSGLTVTGVPKEKCGKTCNYGVSSPNVTP